MEGLIELSKSVEIRHLGSYKELNAKTCLDKKLNTSVDDEFGLPKPLSISLVIPTKIDATKETRDMELNVLRNSLYQSPCNIRRLQLLTELKAIERHLFP